MLLVPTSQRVRIMAANDPQAWVPSPSLRLAVFTTLQELPAKGTQAPFTENEVLQAPPGHNRGQGLRPLQGPAPLHHVDTHGVQPLGTDAGVMSTLWLPGTLLQT